LSRKRESGQRSSVWRAYPYIDGRRHRQLSPRNNPPCRVTGYPHIWRPGTLRSENPMIADRWSPTLGRFGFREGRGYQAESSPVATQHSFRGRSTGQSAVRRGKRASPACRANARSYRALLRSHCSFAYSAFACFRMGMSGSASFQSARKS
jgi:hypothetical protein